MALNSSKLGPVTSSGGRAGHSQQATPLHLESPVPSLHNTQAAALLPLFPLTTHSCELWWLLLQAGHAVGGPWVTSSVCTTEQQPVLCARGQSCGWHCGLQALSSFSLHCVVTGGALCVCGLPVPRGSSGHQARHQTRMNKGPPSVLPLTDIRIPPPMRCVFAHCHREETLILIKGF